VKKAIKDDKNHRLKFYFLGLYYFRIIPKNPSSFKKNEVILLIIFDLK